MKLNNKGYMLVEIIVSFSLTMVIMFFMMNAVVSLKNNADDLYVSTKLETDQMVMTREVMKDINSLELTKVDTSGSTATKACILLDFKDKDDKTKTIHKRIQIDSKYFKYGVLNGDISNCSVAYKNETLFTKKLDNRLNIGAPKVENTCFDGTSYVKCANYSDPKTKANLKISLEGKTAYSDKNYGLMLNIPYNYGDVTIKEPENELMKRGNIGKILGIGRTNAPSINSDQIRKIIISTDEEIPSGIDTWDVSALENGSVRAWITDPVSVRDARTDYINSLSDGPKTPTYLDAYVLHIKGMNAGDIYAPENFEDFFRNYYNLVDINGLEKINTSRVTNMKYLFSDCYMLNTFNINNFNTKNVKNMEFMFYGCHNIISLNFNSISEFKTSEVISMRDMFAECLKLSSLNIENFDTRKVKNMESMFSRCSSLRILDFSKIPNFITGGPGHKNNGVTNMRNMFGDCSQLISLNVTTFDTSSVKDMASMFSGCSSLSVLDLSSDKFNTSSVKIYS